jgi:hypothetical protein
MDVATVTVCSVVAIKLREYPRNAVQPRDLRHPEGLWGSLSNLGKGMKLKIQLLLGCAIFTCAISFAPFSVAQQKTASLSQASISYDVNRETILQGTVVSFTASSQTAPLGAHVTLQTASGAVDVHLGDARLLQNNHFTLNSGDSVHVVGETVTIGNTPQFLARTIQKGDQALTLRSVRGFPVRPVASSTANRQGGVL